MPYVNNPMDEPLVWEVDKDVKDDYDMTQYMDDWEDEDDR